MKSEFFILFIIVIIVFLRIISLGLFGKLNYFWSK